MAENESEGLVSAKKFCKYCKKNAITGPNCKVCGTTYHNSCAQRIKMCCEQLFQEIPIIENVNTHITEEIYLREENYLLKQTIKDKDMIIKDKETLILLLNEKISNLEEFLKLKEEKTINKNTVSHSLKNLTDNLEKTPAQTTKQKRQERNSTTKQTNLEVLQCKQTDIMKHLINLNDDIINPTLSKNETSQKEEDPFQIVTYRKKRKEPKVQGEADIGKDDEINSFMGRDVPEKKIWLFIGKVKDHVTEEMVTKYLQNKVGERYISVKEIDTYKKIKDNRCFKIGMSYDLKEEAYTSSFWPRGVVVYRYDFKKEKYINSLRSKSAATKNFPKVPQDRDFT